MHVIVPRRTAESISHQQARGLHVTGVVDVVDKEVLSVDLAPQ